MVATKILINFKVYSAGTQRDRYGATALRRELMSCGCLPGYQVTFSSSRLFGCFHVDAQKHKPSRGGGRCEELINRIDAVCPYPAPMPILC